MFKSLKAKFKKFKRKGGMSLSALAVFGVLAVIGITVGVVLKDRAQTTMDRQALAVPIDRASSQEMSLGTNDLDDINDAIDRVVESRALDTYTGSNYEVDYVRTPEGNVSIRFANTTDDTDDKNFAEDFQKALDNVGGFPADLEIQHYTGNSFKSL